MKAIAFTLLALTSLSVVVGCDDPRMDNIIKTSPDVRIIPEKVYTISCEGPEGWTKYQTERHPQNAYNGRSGIWKLKTIEGDSVWATNCTAVIKAE